MTAKHGVDRGFVCGLPTNRTPLVAVENAAGERYPKKAKALASLRLSVAI